MNLHFPFNKIVKTTQMCKTELKWIAEFCLNLITYFLMKRKSTSESSLEELLKQKKHFKSAMISLGILWAIVFTIIIIIAKYKLLTIFFPLAIAAVIPIYIAMNEINTEIKKRDSQDN